jgi:23S rRNA (cytidine2498-2'-O)-methyltransferase
MKPFSGRVFEAVPGFEEHLEKELGTWDKSFSPFYYCPDEPANPVFWFRNRWDSLFSLDFSSISEAASALRQIQRNWAPSLFTKFRRGALLSEKLPPISKKPKPFPWLLPKAPMGAWTLLDEHRLLGSALTASPFPGGLIQFIEDKFGPPSRAYLKLQEALTRLGRWPTPGERCIDAGACPGGWTWVLARLGASVLAIDRAPLDERVADMPGVRFMAHDAFTLKPEELGPVDWLFSDVICYPARLYDWIEKWLTAGLCKNYVCTIKWQDGDLDQYFDISRRFAAIPGSQVVHLCYNKHELTWMHLEAAA